jgi:hypothetical protein
VNDAPRLRPPRGRRQACRRAAGTRAVEGRVAHAAGHGVRYSELGAGEVTGA